MSHVHDVTKKKLIHTICDLLHLMSVLKLKDMVIVDHKYDPKVNNKSHQFSIHDPNTKEFIFTCDEFHTWWAGEQQTGLWVHRPNQYSTFYSVG